MKRTLLTILPIAAALLLATSCSKDSDNDNGTDDVHIVSTANTGTDDVHIVFTDESDTIPFSIKVVTSNDGLSKIGYDDAGGKVTPSFTTSDVTAKLAMTISEGEKELGTLTLQDIDGNFSGTLTTKPAEDATLTATITTTGNATSSTVSITDLMEKCAHKYTGSFAYKTDTKVMLTDDKAYIEIIMSPLQHNIDVTIGSDKQNFAMSDDGKVWIAVDGGTKFTMNFTDEKTTTAGKITTIKREGLVDLGLSDGTLWADANATSNPTITYNGVAYYSSGDLNNALSGKLTLPSHDKDYSNLYEQCYWQLVPVDGDDSKIMGYNIFKSKNSADKGVTKESTETYSTATDSYIFLPADGGCHNGVHPLMENTVNIKGYYYAPSVPATSNNTISFDKSGVNLTNGGWGGNCATVRLVRHKE